MTGKRSVAALTVGGAAVLAALVFVGWRAMRPAPAVEYPADPADQPPAAVAFDPSTLTAPGCPTVQPDPAPAPPGVAGDDKLVDWGAVRLVRCTYMLATTTYELERIDLIDDPAKVTDAVRVLRRMLTTAQFDEYFGRDLRDNPVRLMAAFPTYRYLFQFPDGHVTEVDYRDGYHRDGILRHRWSVRGTSIAPLAALGDRGCGAGQSQGCVIDGAMAVVPDEH
jgi:hypothetical protein